MKKNCTTCGPDSLQCKYQCIECQDRQDKVKIKRLMEENHTKSCATDIALFGKICVCR